MWCGSPEHLIVACPRRLKVKDKGIAKRLAPPCHGPPPPRPTAIRWAYIMSKKEVATSSTVVTGTLYLNSTWFSVLFDLVLLIHLYPLDPPWNWTLTIGGRKPIIGSSHPMILELGAPTPINLFLSPLVELHSLGIWFNLICPILTSFREWISCTHMRPRLIIKILRLFWMMEKGEKYISVDKERKNLVPWFLL